MRYIIILRHFTFEVREWKPPSWCGGVVKKNIRINLALSSLHKYAWCKFKYMYKQPLKIVFNHKVLILLQFFFESVMQVTQDFTYAVLTDAFFISSEIL